ncbi:MAG: phosphocholine cytidylyltransferase family protein [Gammaproteobacteria bacterium]|nr:phosphocholine cytidylyltransferase family protein [Gammaproteobacteria bacterium]
MKTAVILAAGMGKRLREAHTDTPKGFLQLDGRSLIEDSIFRLEQAGITNIIIVTGFCAGHYEQLAMRKDGLVTTVHNPRYAESGSFYSLYCARDLIDEGFLLLESDLIYESRALDVLIGHEYSDAVLLSGPTGAGDEVFVEAPTGLLVNMSKDRSKLGSVAGELVGISKISRGLFALLKHMAAEAFESTLQLDYETDGLVAAATSWEIACPAVSDLIWAEIDDPGQLERAREHVLPRLRPD